MAVIRYPGSKAKVANQLCNMFPDSARLPLWNMGSQYEYREPFFGSGAIGFDILDTLRPSTVVWLNDKDFGIYSLWWSVLHEYQALTELVRKFTPTVEWFYKLKEEDGCVDDKLRAGFRKLALHRMSYSGLGVKSGGPLGGREQKSEYNVECRWNQGYICNSIKQAHRILRRFRTLRITCCDFEEVMEGCKAESLTYLDPPYYVKGEQLYKHFMTDSDHERLATILRNTDATWVLSYDDCKRIRTLYDWARIDQITLRYTTAFSSGQRPKNKEIVIRKREF